MPAPARLTALAIALPDVARAEILLALEPDGNMVRAARGLGCSRDTVEAAVTRLEMWADLEKRWPARKRTG